MMLRRPKSSCKRHLARKAADGIRTHDLLHGKPAAACAARDAVCVRLLNLLPSVNLEGEVLDADVVIAVGATVGWTQAEAPATGSFPHKVDDLFRASVGRIPDLFGPSEGHEQVAVEG